MEKIMAFSISKPTPNILKKTAALAYGFEPGDAKCMLDYLKILPKPQKLTMGEFTPPVLTSVIANYREYPVAYCHDSNDAYLCSSTDQWLNLRGPLGVEFLSPKIGLLTQLTRLDLNNNKIKRLPIEFGELGMLDQLNLDANKLQGFPPGFHRLTSLRELKASNNKIRTLDEVYQMERLGKDKDVSDRHVQIHKEIRLAYRLLRTLQ